MKKLLAVCTLTVLYCSQSFATKLVEPEFDGLYIRLNNGKYVELDDGSHSGKGQYRVKGIKGGKQIKIRRCSYFTKDTKLVVVPLKDFHSIVERGGYTIEREYFWRVDTYIFNQKRAKLKMNGYTGTYLGGNGNDDIIPKYWYCQESDGEYIHFVPL